jgi:hypothetical protein
MEFHTCLSETEVAYGDVIYFSDVRWLNIRVILKSVFDLRKAIGEFMACKRNLVPEFSDPEWMSDFGYLTDIFCISTT